MNPENAPSLAMQLGSTALALVLVLALAWLALRALKQFQNRSQRGSGGDRGNRGTAMEVLGSVGLGPRERLVTVRYRDREYLLGVASGGVSLIDSWPEGEAVAGAAAPLSRPLP